MRLIRMLRDGLKEWDGVTRYCQDNLKDHIGVLRFNIDGMEALDTDTLLDGDYTIHLMVAFTCHQPTSRLTLPKSLDAVSCS